MKPYFNIKQDKNTKIATISAKFASKYGWELLLPAVDSDVYYPVKFKQEHNFDVAYIGNNIKDETKTRQYLGVQGIKYGVFGNGFNRPITPKESLSVYNSSFINLNFVIRPDLDVLICRPYQIAACKGFILSEWTESLEKNFGNTIEYVRPGQNPSLRIKETLDKIKSNPAKAKTQREEAYKIVINKFNCEIQAKNLWEWINE
jgi:spore maturation protein CgeB